MLRVLILIVVDVLLCHTMKLTNTYEKICLNPYCSGCASLPIFHLEIKSENSHVLILIVVDVLLCQKPLLRQRLILISLNPYCSGCASLPFGLAMVRVGLH